MDRERDERRHPTSPDRSGDRIDVSGEPQDDDSHPDDHEDEARARGSA